MTPGTVVGMRYRIRGQIGQGGMGRVYRAEHLGLRKDVALKILDASFREADLELRFEREARAAARLDHPACVRVLDHGRTADGRLYLAMELLDGPTLGSWLKKTGRMAIGDAVRTAAELCDALGHAHRKGILHRDVKPENIIFARGERGTRVVLIDFGLAQLRGEAATTATGVCLGSPSYVAPERLLARPYDGRSDLYAVAVVLYEMLAGRPPFVGANAMETARGQIQDLPESVRTYRTDVPQELDDLILMALAKDPVLRFRTADAMRRALELAMAPAYELEPEPDEAHADESAPTMWAMPSQDGGPSVVRRAWGWLRYGGWRWSGGELSSTSL